MTIEAGTVLRALRGLIDVPSRALDVDLPSALQEVVEQLADVLDVRAVAINLLRPAWDDFEIVAIHAPPEIISALRGPTVPRSTIEKLLDPACDVGGAYFIPAGTIDELLIPIRSVDGDLIGFVSIYEPTSGLRPDPGDIDIAIAVAEAAAAAVRGAQRALEARSNRAALELLFELTSSLTNNEDIDQVLLDCCDGIHRALGFERVVIEVADPDSDQLRLRASRGWDDAPPPGMSSLDEVTKLCDPAFEIEGCYLWPADEAVARVGPQARRYESRRNGNGPLAWDHHWLVVPLTHADRSIGGWVWPDDPCDHLLPTPAKLRILRTFADQALAAVSDAAHVDRLEELARLDGLTGALNRRAFFERVDIELQRARRASDQVTLVMYDLDQFKALNDDHGHPAGDAALRSFTRILERNVRASDAVGRVGGDEFALLLVGAGDTLRILDRIATTMEDDPPALGDVRASYGTARAPDDGWSRDELVAAADSRLYDHKRQRPDRHPPSVLVEDVEVIFGD